jgi:hypothetical protein
LRVNRDEREERAIDVTLMMLRPAASPTHYKQGWVICLREPSQSEIELPPYLRVDHQRFERGRDYFKVLEGPHKDVHASVIRGDDASPWVVPAVSYEGGRLVKFLPGRRTLWIPQIDLTVGAYVMEGGQLGAGLHALRIPDHSHPPGEQYLAAGPYRKTWFGIDASGDNYLHPGRFSRGCLTVEALDRWHEIYEHLMMGRDGDQYVGTLQVCRPEASDWCRFLDGPYKMLIDDIDEGIVVQLVFTPVGDECLRVTGVSPNTKLEITAEMALRAGAPCARSLEGLAGGGNLEGPWRMRSPRPGWRDRGHVRVLCHENPPFVPGLHARTGAYFKGTISEGYWGEPGTRRHPLTIRSTAANERPWYDYPWNPGYPWDEPMA